MLLVNNTIVFAEAVSVRPYCDLLLRPIVRAVVAFFAIVAAGNLLPESAYAHYSRREKIVRALAASGCFLLLMMSHTVLSAPYARMSEAVCALAGKCLRNVTPV